MGVDFFPCDECGYTLNDCGDWWECEECGVRLCEDCQDSRGIEGDDCPYCMGDDATPDDLFQYALELLNLSRDELKVRYVAAHSAPGGTNS